MPRWVRNFSGLWRRICVEAPLAAIEAGRLLEFGPVRLSRNELTVWHTDGAMSIAWSKMPTVRARWHLSADELSIAADGEETVHVNIAAGLSTDLIRDCDTLARLCREITDRQRRGERLEST